MKKFIAGLALTLLSATGAQATDMTVTVTNLTQGVLFTPLLVAAHPPSYDAFEIGTAASASLQAMAEGGDISGLTTDLNAVGADIAAVNAGPQGPGVFAPADFTGANATAAANTQLTVLAMLLPTNDGFLGLDSITIPTAPGTYTYYVNGYDAGTEVNNELLVAGGGVPNTLGMPGGSADTGGTVGVTTVEANQNVHIHRGNLGDSMPAGGNSDVNSSVHRWLNPVARVVVTVN